MRSSRPGAGLIAAAVAVLCGLVLLVPTGAVGARLVGGARQTSVRRAFDTTAAHRAQLIVSIRASTVNSAWTVVRSVLAQDAGQTTSGTQPLRLSSAYFHDVGGAERPGSPPRAVRADLARALRVAVVYSGAGAESISYDQTYYSDCVGQVPFTDSERVDVRPMTWTVRYVVELDHVLAATRGPDGAALVPAISFTPAGSTLSAVEHLSRSYRDLGCNAAPTTYECTRSFRLGGADPAGGLAPAAEGGLAVSIPLQATNTGACASEDYPLGRALWDGGAGTAVASRLGLFGGGLPNDPYAPVPVTWAGNSAAQSQSFAATPCQGDGAVCQDDLHWRGTIRLQDVG